MRLTLSPRASRRQPMEAAARPLPREDTTPPVTKMYFADMSATSLYMFLICAWCARLSIAGSGGGGKSGLLAGELRVEVSCFFMNLLRILYVFLMALILHFYGGNWSSGSTRNIQKLAESSESVRTYDQHFRRSVWLSFSSHRLYSLDYRRGSLSRFLLQHHVGTVNLWQRARDCAGRIGSGAAEHRCEAA